jgi:hypothetical protein
MKFVRRLFDLYIDGSLHVGLAAAALAFLTQLFFGVKDTAVLLFVFFSTVLSYNFIKIFGQSLFDGVVFRERLIGKKDRIVLNTIAASYVLYFILGMDLSSILVLIPFGLATFFYIVPIGRNDANLRSVASIKLFLIAITWAGVSVLFPLVHAKVEVNSEVFLVFIQRTAFILAVAIPFDIRDVQFDAGSLRTLPQIFGVRFSKLVGGFSLVLFFVLEFFREEGQNVFVTGMITLLAGFFLLFSRENQNRYYTTFWVESIPVLWLFLYLAA